MQCHNCEIVFREDCEIDEFIDLLEGNRRYIKCLYCYNKADAVTLEELDVLARQPNSMVMSCHLNLNADRLLARMWEMLAMVRVYTRRRGEPPGMYVCMYVCTYVRVCVCVCIHTHSLSLLQIWPSPRY
jgi:ribosome-interacting GTPase 1